MVKMKLNRCSWCKNSTASLKRCSRCGNALSVPSYVTHEVPCFDCCDTMQLLHSILPKITLAQAQGILPNRTAGIPDAFYLKVSAIIDNLIQLIIASYT